MSNLFRDLYAYRQRENKDPKEDWLTECLAATMRALPRDALQKVVADFSAFDVLDPNENLAEDELKIHTQFPIGSGGRPDMLITLNGQPWIVIENKVGHSVGVRIKADGSDSHQLGDYADWLWKESRDCRLRPAMVFITHLTRPPEDFSSRATADRYYGFRRHATSWGSLARKFMALTSHLDEVHHARVMAETFLGYLEDQNMSDEMPDSTAFAAAQMYVGYAAELENLVDAMWQRACTIANFGKTSDYILKAVTDQGSVSAWRYVAPTPVSPSRNTYVETGIWYPEIGAWYDRENIGSDLRGAQVYVGLFNNEDDYFLKNPSGDSLDFFIRPCSDFMAVKAVADFPSDPQVRGELITDWVEQRAVELRKFLLSNKLVM